MLVRPGDSDNKESNMAKVKKLIDAKAIEAKHLRLNGMTQQEIATQMGCSVRSVRTYLQHDVEGEEEMQLSTISPNHLEELLAVGQPLLLSLLKNIERLLEEDRLSPRDTIIAYGVVADKMGRLSRTKKEDASEVEILKAKLLVSQYNEAVAIHALEQVRKGDMRYLDGVVEETTEIIEDGVVVEGGNE